MTFCSLPTHSRRVDAIPVLVAAGADVNSVADASGVTPLELAARHKNVNAMNSLIAAGADVGVLKKRGARKARKARKARTAEMRAYSKDTEAKRLAAIALLPDFNGPVWVRVAW